MTETTTTTKSTDVPRYAIHSGVTEGRKKAQDATPAAAESEVGRG